MSYSFNSFQAAVRCAVANILTDPNMVMRVHPAELAGRWYLERIA